MVIGVILGALLVRYDAYMKIKSRDETTVAMNNLEVAFNEFFYQNNRHPCPADPTLTIADADYGAEGDCSVATAAEPAVIGMVPFKTLNIPEDAAYDGWHNRLTYAVTRSMTVAPVLVNTYGDLGRTVISYDAGMGALSYAPEMRVDEFGNTVPVTGRYAVISHGDNGAGAYNAQGIIFVPCITPGLPAVENDNCDGDADFTTAATNRYFATYVQTTDYYDDMVDIVTQVTSRIWTVSAANRSDIYTKTSHIGIGTESPDTSVTIDVAGNVRANDLRTGLVCDQDDPGRCFDPDIISGNESIMECSGVMIGIQNGAAICANMGFVAGTPGTCGPGTYAVGFNASGAIICE